MDGDDDDGGYADVNVDEAEEEELLRGLPCAFDEVAPPPPPPLPPAPIASRTSIITTNTSNICDINVYQACIAADMEQRGVLDFPPLRGSSFMMRGDNGLVRWVTSRQDNTYNDLHKATMNEGEGAAHDNACDSEKEEEEEEEDMELHVLRLQQAQRAAHMSTHERSSSTSDNICMELGLLGAESMSHLLQQVYESLAEDKTRKAVLLQQAQAQAQAQTSTLSEQHKGQSKSRRRSAGALWVDAYAPRRFRDILSDDAMSLQLLQWLKSWDSYVFGSTSNTNNKTNQENDDEEEEEESSAMRSTKGAQAELPAERMAVLVGPPGVGKTTLVHVLARHCGYEVIEVNASMERTTTRLEATIKMAVSAMPTPAALRRRTQHYKNDAHEESKGHDAHSMTPSSLRKSTRTMPHEGRGTHRQPYEEEQDSSSTTSNTIIPSSSMTLVQHLLRPKCLVLDEMDGIAGNVAHFLLAQEIHRPVFCLCNDWYAPGLRLLRQHCGHVFRLPPVKPQRLLARLNYIAECEEVAIESAALAELVRVSNGDIRSCINTLQFLSTALQHSSSTNNNTGASSSGARITTGQLLRSLQGKDAVFDVWSTWANVFQRRGRARSVLLLQQECGIDYDALRLKATATNANSEAQGSTYNNHSYYNYNKGVHNTSNGAAVSGFHVDPGYLYLAHTLARTTNTTLSGNTSNTSSNGGGMSSFLLDGVQENYLQRPYLDYSLSRTAQLADGLAQYDVLLACARLRAASLIPFAERYEQCVALLTYVLCSSTTQATALSFPRLQARLHERRTAVGHILRSFQHGCTQGSATHTLQAYLTSSEMLACDVCPMLTRCLYDTALHFPLHATTATMLPAAMQPYIARSVARHMSYGLTYEQSRGEYHASASELGFAASTQNGQTNNNNKSYYQAGRPSWAAQQTPQATQPRSDEATPTNTNTPFGNEERGTMQWHLVPEIDLFLRPMSTTPYLVPSQALKAFMVGELARELVRQRMARRSEQQQRYIQQQQQQQHEKLSAASAAQPGATASAAVKNTKKEDDDTSLIKQQHTAVKTEAAQDTKRATGTQGASPTGALPPVKRDFFGRPILVTPSTANAQNNCKAGGGSGGGVLSSSLKGSLGSKRPHSQQASSSPLFPGGVPKVRYVYHDGATNAVKMDATFRDFA